MRDEALCLPAVKREREREEKETSLPLAAPHAPLSLVSLSIPYLSPSLSLSLSVTCSQDQKVSRDALDLAPQGPRGRRGPEDVDHRSKGQGKQGQRRAVGRGSQAADEEQEGVDGVAEGEHGEEGGLFRPGSGSGFAPFVL